MDLLIKLKDTFGTSHFVLCREVASFRGDYFMSVYTRVLSACHSFIALSSFKVEASLHYYISHIHTLYSTEQYIHSSLQQIKRLIKLLLLLVRECLTDQTSGLNHVGSPSPGREAGSSLVRGGGRGGGGRALSRG